MGSSGGSFDFSSRGDDKSEKIFQSSTDEVDKAVSSSEGAQRNVFISFDIEDQSAVNLLRSQAKDDRFPFGFRDYSVKEPFESKWKTEVSNLISMTSATIVMIGPDTAKSAAVDWEIREAHRQNKKVIGVRIHRDQNDPVPAALSEFKDPVINWDTKTIGKHLE